MATVGHVQEPTVLAVRPGNLPQQGEGPRHPRGAAPVDDPRMAAVPVQPPPLQTTAPRRRPAWHQVRPVRTPVCAPGLGRNARRDHGRDVRGVGQPDAETQVGQGQQEPQRGTRHLPHRRGDGRPGDGDRGRHGEPPPSAGRPLVRLVRWPVHTVDVPLVVTGRQPTDEPSADLPGAEDERVHRGRTQPLRADAHRSTRRERATATPGRAAVARVVERMTRFELATSTLARWRSSQLSYIRVRLGKVTGPAARSKTAQPGALSRRRRPAPRTRNHPLHAPCRPTHRPPVPTHVRPAGATVARPARPGRG